MSFNPSGGTGTGLASATITQAAHNFQVGDFVYQTSTLNTYALASAASPATSEVIGMVQTVPTANTFTLATAGLVTGLSGLTIGQVYWLSTTGTTGNTFTLTQPTGVSNVSKPLFVAVSTTTAQLEILDTEPAQGQTAVVSYATLTTAGTGANAQFQNISVTGSSAFTTVVSSANRIVFNNPAGGTTPRNIASSGISVNTATGVLTFSVPGTYHIEAHCSATLAARIYLQAVQNSTLVGLGESVSASASDEQTMSLSANITAAAGDTLDFRIGADTTGTVEPVVFSYNILQIGASPVPMDLAGEYGQTNLGATFTGPTSISTAQDVMSFTIPSAGTWEVKANIYGNATSSAGRSLYWFTDNSNNLVGGVVTDTVNGGGANMFQMACIPVFITTTGAATYKLRFSANVANTIRILASASDDGAFGQPASQPATNVQYRKISGFTPSSGQMVDYVNAALTADQTGITTAGTDIIFNTSTGNIPLNTSTGVFTLTAGKTYELEAVVAGIGIGSATNPSGITYAWTDTSGTNLVANQGQGTMSVVNTTGINNANNKGSVPAKLIYTPNTNQQVKVRVIGVSFNGITSVTASSGTSINNGTTYVSIKQLGSSNAITNLGQITMQAQSTTAQSIPNNTNTTLITGWSTNIDTNSGFNTTTGLYTVPAGAGGYYQVSGNVAYASNATGARVTSFVVNGTTFNCITQLNPGATGVTFNSCSGLVKLNAGDTIGLNAFQTSGGALNTAPGATLPQLFSLSYLHS